MDHNLFSRPLLRDIQGVDNVAVINNVEEQLCVLLICLCGYELKLLSLGIFSPRLLPAEGIRPNPQSARGASIAIAEKHTDSLLGPTN
jgi:hypothetical protein